MASADDALCPSVDERSLTTIHEVFLVLGGSLFVALSSRIVLVLPFTPVPVTGQTLAVLAIGATLGARRGALSLLAYLLEGAIGLPVFAGGAAGIARLVGPTGGYLWGFVAAAYVVGSLVERGWGRRLPTALASLSIGNASLYLFGLSWLARFVGVDKALPLGLYPFVAGDLVKMVLVASAMVVGRKVLSLAHGKE